MLTLERRLADHQRQTEDTKAREWKQFALRIATTPDEDHDPEEVLAELDRLGKSLDDLQAVAGLVTRRRELSAQMAGLPELESTSQEATQKLLTEVERFSRARDEHERKRRELSLQCDIADARKADAQNARRELLSTCRQDIRDELTALRTRLGPLESDRNTHRDAVAINQKRTDDYGNLIGNAAENIDNAQAALELLEPQVTELREQIAELERQALDPNAVSF